MNIEEHIMERLVAETITKTGDDVPVGCYILDKDNNIISKGFNNRYVNNNIHGHAEINAINNLVGKYSKAQINGFKLFVTLEPCPMCAQAICDFGIKVIYYSCVNEITKNISREIFNINHITMFEVKNSEYQKLLRDFFKKIRTDVSRETLNEI